jgi:NADPH:quinone reductase-like Zn-dependent oxidoreductase
MLANVLVKRGGRTVLEVRQVPDPQPGPGEVVIEVQATALNHLDLFARDHHTTAEDPPPQIIGSDAAGTVTEVGQGVDFVAVGDEVVLNPGLSCDRCPSCRRGQASECSGFDIVGRGVPGTYAQKVAVPATNLAPRPPHLSWEEAAALSLDHLTAWRMVMTKGLLRAGDTVLVHGIGGGAALAALQLAKLGGAWVIVTSSSDEKLRKAEQLGSDEVFNYLRVSDIAAAVREGTASGVDLVVDTVGAVTLPSSIRAARNGGRVVICGATTGAEGTIDIREVFWRQISILGSTMGSHEDYNSMLAAVTAGHLAPIIDSVWHPSEAEAALDRLQRGEQFGKIVLSSTAGPGRWPDSAGEA